MMRPVLLLLGTILIFGVGSVLIGYEAMYRLGYGAIVLLALVIALTFFWLWLKQATPLALGMVFSWTGASCVMGWWWIYSILGEPDWMRQNPLLFAFLSIYLIGAVLHLEVIGRSFALSQRAIYAPVVLAILLSLMVSFAV